jgi:hypothetical protein
MIAMWCLALLVMHMCLCNKQSLDPGDSDRSGAAQAANGSPTKPHVIGPRSTWGRLKERSTFTSLTIHNNICYCYDIA